MRGHYFGFLLLLLTNFPHLGVWGIFWKIWVGRRGFGHAGVPGGARPGATEPGRALRAGYFFSPNTPTAGALGTPKTAPGRKEGAARHYFFNPNAPTAGALGTPGTASGRKEGAARRFFTARLEAVP